MVKFLGGNGQAFISKKQKDLAVKSIAFVLKWYGKISLLDNLESQPIILTINPRNVLSTVLLVLIFELKWWNFLEAMGRHLSQKSKHDLAVKSIPFV